MTPELAPEDALRLHVLLAGAVHAVRIDDSQLTLYALTPQGEARVLLHRNCRPDLYLQRVRELLAGHAMGSPGGYPTHLFRWTSMGHASPKNLAALLKLGEPEAVTAVALAPGLDLDLAQRAWWALPSMDTARNLLGHTCVREAPLGQTLADFLIEHLPFEEDPIRAMNLVRSVVGAGLLSGVQRAQLWAKARHRPHYFLGFLEHCPDTLPPAPAHPLQTNIDGQGQWGALLQRCYSPSGQSFLQAASLALDKPPAAAAVYLLLDIIGHYFGSVRAQPLPTDWPETLQPQAQALAALAQVSQADALPILTRTSAVGPQMRRHLEPVFKPLQAHLQTLRAS